MTRYRHLITDDNRKWWTLGAMCFALFMIMLDNTVVNVALPSIQRDLGASLAALEWTINGYTLSFAVLLATGGRLGDIFGRRRMFIVGVIIFALSSATAGLAADTTSLVVSRIVQGVGAAMILSTGVAIVTDVDDEFIVQEVPPEGMRVVGPGERERRPRRTSVKRLSISRIRRRHLRAGDATCRPGARLHGSHCSR